MAGGRKFGKKRRSLKKESKSDDKDIDAQTNAEIDLSDNQPIRVIGQSVEQLLEPCETESENKIKLKENSQIEDVSFSNGVVVQNGEDNLVLSGNQTLGHRLKRRKVHLNSLDCMSLSQTDSGTKALSKPFEVPRNSRNPHQGLQPRPTRRKRFSKHKHEEDTNEKSSNNSSVLNQDKSSNSVLSERQHFKEACSLESNRCNENSNSLPSTSTGFTTASSLVSLTSEKETDTIDQFFESNLGFSSASNLVGLTESQIEVGGFKSSKSAVEKTFRRIDSKLKRARETAGPSQKNISNFFTKSTTVKTTLPKKETMEPPDQHRIHSSPSSSQESSKNKTVMYSPIRQMSGSIYVSDSSPEQTPKKSQNGCSQPKQHENPTVKKLFDGQKNLVAGQPPSKKRKQTASQPVSSMSSSQKPSTSVSHNHDSSASNSLSLSQPVQNHQSSTGPADSETDETTYQQTYGLLGQGSPACFPDPPSTVCTVNYFEILPLHLIEHIFSQLPILDLCLNSNRVCRQWNDIISDEKFVPWKKKYHKLKLSHGNVYAEIQGVMKKYDMTLPSKYLKGLISYMKDFKRVSALNMSECLKEHPKYDWADALIKERVPNCVEKEECNPWCVITTLVIISDSVEDITAIIRCLTVSQSQCTSMEVLECLYCIATFLYAFRLKSGPEIWSGMHYRVYYAVYLYENTSVSNHAMLQEAIGSSNSGQQTMVKYGSGDTSVRLTHEQVRIIKYSPNNGDVVKIVAFAGTGKTTTLVRYTQMRPHKKFLLVVYNKSVCTHAQKKFPHNVTCKTGHALAFASVGRRYTFGGKLRNLKVYDITQVLPPRKGDNLYVRAKFVMETINTYCSSDDDNISSSHVPNERKDDNNKRIVIDHAAKMRYVEDAEYLWKRMKDIKDARVGMSHDGYLKLYQLNRPRMHQYDIILIDEAQDLTPAVIDILRNQRQAKILVGDPHQQIYSFRGAVNAMTLIPSSQTFYLTQSFRFGPEISQVAASCLEVFKNVKEKTIVGHGKPGHCRGEKVGQIAFICRNNFTVFAEAVKKCCYTQEDYKVAFVGGTDAFGFPMILDIYTLMLSDEDRKNERRLIVNKLISKFSSLAALEKYATQVVDNELLGKIRIVRTYHHNIPIHISRIRSRCVNDCERADFVFSTAHKAKGLEFSTVHVTDDFINLQQYQGIDIAAIGFKDLMNSIQIPADETNLLYVAVTRAKHALLMSPTLLKVLKDNGEKFEYPVLSTHLEKSCVPFKCMQTDAEFKPKALTLRKLEVSLGEGEPKQSGLLSPVILSEDFHRFAELLGDPDVKGIPKQRMRIPVHIRIGGQDGDSDDSDDDVIFMF